MNYSIAIIIVCIGILITLAVVETFAEEEDYNFVKCPNDINTYPEGTSCDGLPDDYNDDNIDSEQATDDEEKAMKRAK